ncbi:MAG: pyridoxamine 5'-phosphate oxidase family protein [Cyclobacteriaceae bacterium]
MLIRSVDSLESVQNKVWDELQYGTMNPAHPFRFAVLSTVNGKQPVSRYVVFRKLDKDKVMKFYTDSRSAKVEDLKTNPQCSLLFYHPDLQVQISFQGKTVIHQNDSLSNRLWQTVPERNRVAYTSVCAPGRKISSPKEAFQWSETDYFCVVDVFPESLDVLQLNGQEHYRARFEKGSTDWEGSWITP